MSNQLDLTRGWFRKGESDLQTCRLLNKNGPYDTACFPAQQAGEKYLKRLIAFHGVQIPRTHNLEELELLCIGLTRSPTLTGIDVTLLTPYAVQMRYDAEFWPDYPTAGEAMKVADKIKRAILDCMPPETYP
jgi:HEPN domain-containing protein